MFRIIGDRDGFRCWVCGATMTLDTFTLDHYIPKSRWTHHLDAKGQDMGANHPSNLRLACAKCNRERGCEIPEGSR